MTTDSVLASIDATVDGRCACGCGRELDPSSRSGWWATEDCQARWQHSAVRPGEVPPRIALSPDDLERLHEAMRAGLAATFEAVAAWARQLHEALAPMLQQLERVGVFDEAEPSDPRERALWLRRNRNTGPRADRQWSVRRLARQSRRSPR